ncbi:MAG: radical SAM family heme chaperone HemW [Turicibacter sp.]
MTKGLYIHIPFCDHICTYCDFPKLFTKGQKHDDYIQALIKELEEYYKIDQFSSIQTIYIGGGTPTALSIEQIKPLFDWLEKQINMNQIIEFTIEANPENLSEEKIKFLSGVGITRFSLGVQTFNLTHLNTIGRKHDPTHVKTAIKNLKNCGVSNINIDLIYSIPGQSLDDLKADLEILKSLDIEHVSAYSLIVEEHTKLYLDYMKDKLELVDNTLEATMYEFVMSELKKMGYTQYEISNFSKSKPSIHNQWYWKNESYYGTGLGAHGYILGSRYQNTRSIHQYIEKLTQGELPTTQSHVLSLNEKIEEEMFLGLRLMKGINLAEINEKYQVDLESIYGEVFRSLITKGYLEQAGSHVFLTATGLLLANDVFEEFLLSV